MINGDFSKEISKKIEDIRKKILTGEIRLINFELAPIFNKLKDSLNIYNLSKYSNTYRETCELLNQKFEDFKNLLSSLDTEKKFLEYLKKNPNDLEIAKLFDGCWRQTFNVDALSLEFLELCRDRLCKGKSSSLIIERLERVKVKDDFLLEIPKQKFTEKMNEFFNNIQDKLPCLFNEIFDKKHDQLKIYENFVYLLHLLQLGKIKYQKETNSLYL